MIVPHVTKNVCIQELTQKVEIFVDNVKKFANINKYTTQVCGCKSMPVAGKAIHVSSVNTL